LLLLSKERALRQILSKFERHNMDVSENGLRFIAMWEGLRLTKYDDGGAGKGNCTIGFGHLIHTSPCDGRASEAEFSGGLTADGALRLFRKDVQRYVDGVNQHTKVALNQNQFDAMVDFAYNCGWQTYAWGNGGLPAIAPVVNARGDVCAAIMRHVLPAWATEGLTRRRREECKLFGNTVIASPPAQEDRVYTDKQIDEKIGAVLTAIVSTNKKADAQSTLLEILVPSLVTGTPAEAQMRYIWAAAGKPWPVT